MVTMSFGRAGSAACSGVAANEPTNMQAEAQRAIAKPILNARIRDNAAWNPKLHPIGRLSTWLLTWPLLHLVARCRKASHCHLQACLQPSDLTRRASPPST